MGNVDEVRRRYIGKIRSVGGATKGVERGQEGKDDNPLKHPRPHLSPLLYHLRPTRILTASTLTANSEWCPNSPRQTPRDAIKR